MILTLLRWLAFLWGCLACAAMVYFAAKWFPHADDPRKNEMALGFAFSTFYGWPAWVSLPVFTLVQWRELKPWHRLLLMLPVALAIALWIVGWWLSHS